MPLGLFTLVAIFLTTWWIVLFIVLPIGTNRQDVAPPTDGSQWGAPETPNLKKKFITTTWVALVIWMIIVGIVWSGVLQLPEIDVSRLPAL